MLLLRYVSLPRWRNGRRARFRCECLTACRFESYPGHKGRLRLKSAFLYLMRSVGCADKIMFIARPTVCANMVSARLLRCSNPILGTKSLEQPYGLLFFCAQDTPFLLKTERHFVYLHTQHYGLSYDKRYNRKD